MASDGRRLRSRSHSFASGTERCVVLLERLHASRTWRITRSFCSSV